VNIDSGAAYGGLLTTIVIEGRDVWVLEDQGRTPLRP
jgi:serine/threonine protein phosphatase 1